MRRFSPSAALVAAGALVWGCSVYDSSLVPADNSLIGAGDAPSSSGNSTTNQSGNSSSTAGKTTTPATGGQAGGGQPSSATGGTIAVSDGGEGGDSPDVSGGTGGSVGGGSSGGSNAGSGGSGGTSKAGSGGGGTAGKASGGAAGTGGSGGAAPVAKCADHPIPLKTMWKPTASASSLGNGMESDGLYNPPAHLTDGLLNERWSSGQPQAGDEWIQIDFGVVVNITQLTLNVNQDTSDYPRAYAVRISNTTEDFNAAVKSSGVGMLGNTAITFPAPITGQFLTVRQTGVDVLPDTKWWTVAEVLVGCTD